MTSSRSWSKRECISASEMATCGGPGRCSFSERLFALQQDRMPLMRKRCPSLAKALPTCPFNSAKTRRNRHGIRFAYARVDYQLSLEALAMITRREATALLVGGFAAAL